jgi:L-ascorbate metabolism protein UlaG (beta-lactamase superfamily)
MSVSLTWHGHASLSLDVDGKKILIDPFFAPDNPAAKLTQDQVSADYILVTHGHGDHVADGVSIAKRTGALVISNFEICNWFDAQGYGNVHAQHIGGGFDHPFGRVKLTIAFHGSALPDGTYGGMPAGFLLHVGGKVIYIAGDTALYSDMQLTGQAGLDLAILPIGDNFTMGPNDALQAVKFLTPRVVVPCHYNTWPPIQQDVHAWAKRVNSETNSEAVVLEVEQQYPLL